MALRKIFEHFGVNTLEQSAAYAIGGATAPALEWIVRPIAYTLNAENRTLILEPDQAAQAEIRLAGTGFDGDAIAAQNGLTAGAYSALLASLKTPPDGGTLIELLRRHRLKEDDVRLALRRNGMDERWIDDFLAMREVLLSAEDLAMARQQGFITEDAARTRSTLVGVDPEDADLLFELAGLPPGAEQMIDLWRRGEIGEDRVRQSLIEGHTKIKYVDDVLKLKFQPLSASVAAEALVRQRITKSEAVAIAEKNGLREDDFLLWSDMLGRPIATGQALQLARRGEFTFEQFKEAVARSDVRTEYADDLWKLRRTLPNLFQVRALISSGAITDAKATEIVIDLGYDPDIASGIVSVAKGVKHKHTKDLAAAQIDTLFESGLESREWAVASLVGLGYDNDEAEWHLELLEARRLLSALTSNLSLIHREFVGHKIDETQVTTMLDQFGMASEARNILLETWTNERNANIARLSNAQIGQALKHAGMTREEAIQRWMSNGYPQDDATWLADIAQKAPHNAIPTTA